jgi:hypothetical protein
MHNDADDEYSSTSSFIGNVNDALVRKSAELALENEHLHGRITSLKAYLWAVFWMWVLSLWFIMSFIMEADILTCKKKGV